MKQMVRSLVLSFLILTLTACSMPFIEDLASGLARLELFVSTTGDDSHDCQTEERACLTIGRAVAVANGMDGAILRIAPGSYREPEKIFIRRSMSLLGSGLVVVEYFSADTAGGIFYLQPPSPTSKVRMENMTLLGGNIGVVALQGSLLLSNVNIRQQTAVALDLDDEIGVPTVVVEGGEFSNSSSAVHVRGLASTLTLRGVTLANNTSTALINRGGRVDMDGVSIFGNHGQSTYPSAILNTRNSGSGIGSGGVMNINHSAIYNNTHDGDVRNVNAIFNAGELLAMFNTTVSGNAGSGILSGRLSETVLTHVTIANHPRNGIVLVPTYDLRLRMTNTLVVYNGRDCDFRNPYSGIDILDIEGTIDSDNTCLDAQAADRAAWDFYPGVDGILGSNGGSTPTHALFGDSPAIDAVVCPSGVVTDQRGESRPQGMRCDIGAFERLPSLGEPPVVPTPVPVIQTTPESTLPSVPTQIDPTPTPFSPMVRLIVDANCRYGPGTAYQVLTAMVSGTELPVEGRNAEKSWWVVRLPGGSQCWISAITVETLGSVGGLPVIPPPPLPTSTATKPPLPTSTVITPPLQIPAAPQQPYIDNRICNGQQYSVSLRWIDAASNEDGYRIYRDGSLLSTLGAGATQFTDTPPFGGSYTYEIEAFNAAGVSARAAVSESGCIP